MKSKITVRDDRDKWHTFEGGELQFERKDDYVTIMQFTTKGGKRYMDELGLFRNPVSVKREILSVDEPETSPAVAPAMDTFTAKELESRGEPESLDIHRVFPNAQNEIVSVDDHISISSLEVGPKVADDTLTGEFEPSK